MNKVFQFKQFAVDQTDCAMKVNTDAALIGALANTDHTGKILEIGTGTGVISLMVAQRSTATIEAVEISEKAAKTAELNFRNSPFSDRINIIVSSFEDHFSRSDEKYDLIISNPPYFINSLKSDDDSKKLARHTDISFFEHLIEGSARHLTPSGRIYLILPIDTAESIKHIAAKSSGLKVDQEIFIHSFSDSEPFRNILVLGLNPEEPLSRKFVIYERQNTYTEEYRTLLQNYLTIF
jgi:tRNA1Val (adenine37-N6)-methyltransferase